MAFARYDLIVVGAGSGLDVAVAAAEHGMKVALVEEGPMGGTCLNRGCIPSKILIQSAETMEEISRAGLFGIGVKGVSADFRKIMARARRVDKEAAQIEANIRKGKALTLYKERAAFSGMKALKVKAGEITADKIVIAAGSRPAIPKVEGLGKVKFMTSDDALRAKALPERLIILGGGYIAAEFAHFFGSLGSKITILQRNSRLLPNEDEQVSQMFTDLFAQKYDVRLGFRISSVKAKGDEIICTGDDGSEARGTCLLVATGRIPNTDILRVEKTGVKVDARGFVQADEFLETSVKGIWTLGDIAGRYMFKHSANMEARAVFNNLVHPDSLRKADYTAMPHAVFSSPQVAGAGATEQELREKKEHYIASHYHYGSTAMGGAMEAHSGIVKFITDHKGAILGCHIIGPHASVLIHEVLVAMRAGLRADEIAETVHIHPSLSEVVERAAASAGPD